MKNLLLTLILAGVAFGQSPSVALTWNAPDPTNPPGILTNMYRKPGACTDATGQFTKLNTAGIAGTAYTDATVLRGSIYCYRITYFTAAMESAPSSTAGASVPLRPPTGLSVTVDGGIAATIKDASGNVLARAEAKLQEVTVVIPAEGQ